MQQPTDRLHFRSYLSFSLTDFVAGWLVLTGRQKEIQHGLYTNDKKPSRFRKLRAYIRVFSVNPILAANGL